MEQLCVRNLSKSFGGLAAVQDISFDVNKGQVVSIIGPNGAGKTTVFNLVTGIYIPDTGTIILNDRDITGLKTYRMVEAGVARTFQNIRLFHQMTVLQNVIVGYQSKIKSNLFDDIFSTPKKWREEKLAIEYSRKILDTCGLLKYENDAANSLPYGKQRKLEIARAMVSKPEYLFLDEPAAGLNIQETTELSEFVKILIKMGFTVVLIEHDMRMVMKISDYIYVMDHGRKIMEGIPSEVQKDEKVIEAYIGRKGGTHHVSGS